jgi:hypothetical protein
LAIVLEHTFPRPPFIGGLSSCLLRLLLLLHAESSLARLDGD